MVGLNGKCNPVDKAPLSSMERIAATKSRLNQPRRGVGGFKAGKQAGMWRGGKGDLQFQEATSIHGSM
jgi:hypothetical protein